MSAYINDLEQDWEGCGLRQGAKEKAAFAALGLSSFEALSFLFTLYFYCSESRVIQMHGLGNFVVDSADG